MSTTTKNTRHGEEYVFTLSDVFGVEFYSCSGTLRHVLAVGYDHLYCDVEAPNYQKVRRELLAGGGAFACFLPCTADGPLLLRVVSAALVERRPVVAEYRSPAASVPFPANSKV